MGILKTGWPRGRLVIFIGLLAASLVISGCGRSTSKPTNLPATEVINTLPATPSVTRTPIPTLTKTPISTPSPTLEPYLFTISQDQAIVSSGQSQPLKAFQANETRPFPEGYLLTTDENGEALLLGRLDAASCRIYVFQDTELQKRPCPESTYSGGNASCVEGGSAVYQDCSNHLAMTPSGEVEFQGTWVQVIYLPDKQVSIFVAAQGNAQVSPVRGTGSSRLSRPIPLAEGQFLYTAPDAVMSAIPGLPPRQALSVDRLPALLPEYNILPWLGRGYEKLPPDNNLFPSPDLLTGPPDLVTSLEVTGLVSFGGRQSPVLIPVRVTVTNRGGQAADIFKVSIDGSSQLGTFVRPFFTQNNPDGTYPFSTAPLQPGGQIVFDGQVGLSRNDLGQQVILTALADSCSGEEFTPAECRVKESDENNNVSKPVTVPLSPYP